MPGQRGFLVSAPLRRSSSLILLFARCFFISAILLIACSTNTARGASNVVRVFVPLWLTDYGESTSFDSAEVKAEATAFFLAARHFNERRHDIVPELAAVAECEKNLTIVRICDESANSRRASALLKEFAGQFDIVVGMASMAAEAAAIKADVDEDKPLLSHWSTAESLSDKDKFPLFSRTFISDSAYYGIFARFVAQLGFSKLSILYVDDDTAPSSAKTFMDKLVEYGIDALAFPYMYDDPESIHSALARIKDTSRTVIAYLGYKTDLEQYVQEFAAESGLNSTEHLWIFSSTDTLSTEEEINSSPALANLMRGALFISFGTSDASSLQMFQGIVRTEVGSDTEFLDEINQRLPPFGFANETGGSCGNDALDIQLEADFFQKFSIDDLPESFAPAYDAIMAAGIAMCQDPSADLPESGEGFSELIRSVSLHGLSGLLKFDENGDRMDETTTFQVLNYRSTSEGIRRFLVGTYNGSHWNFGNESEIELRAGFGLLALPGDYTQPDEHRNYLPSGLITLGYVEVAIGTAAAIACLIWMSRNLDEPVIRAAQPRFMTLAVFGCLSITWAILPLTADDNSTNGIAAGYQSCMAIPFLYFLGTQIALGAVLGKTLRAYVVFERSSRFYQKFRTRHMLASVVLMYAVSMTLLIIWSSVGPMEYVRIIMVTDRFDQTMESRGECSFDDKGAGIGILAALSVIYLIGLISLRVLSGLAPKRFIEERNLSSALLQTFALLVPALVAASNHVIGRFVILSTFFFLSNLIVLVFLFLPKRLAIIEQRRYRRLVAAMEMDSESQYRNGSSGGNDVNILDALRVPMVQAKFARYAEDNFVTESFLFILDVLTYKEKFHDSSPAWRADKATTIMKLYVRAGSLLQVNISERCREQVIALYKAQSTTEFTESLYDRPLNEIASMLTHGAWGAFVAEGGMYNIRASLMPRSKLLSMFTNDDAIRTGRSNGQASTSDLAAASLPRTSGF